MATDQHTLEEQIAALQQEVATHDAQLLELQTKIRGLAQHPSARAQTLQELEARLPKMQQSLAIAKDQKTMYMGTDLEDVMVADAEQAEEKVKRIGQQIEETRVKHRKQNAADEKELKRLQSEEQTISQKRHNLVRLLSDLQQQRTIQDAAEGEQRAKLIAARLLELQEDRDAKRHALELAEWELKSCQDAALNQLEGWPDLQMHLMEQYQLEPTDGPLKIAQSAIAYLEALITERLTLPGVVVTGNEPIASVMALTDVEICSETWQGGIVNLQRKRATLLDFVEKRKSALVGG